jgi:hypothetical protein
MLVQYGGIPKVLCGLWHDILKKLKLHPALLLPANADCKRTRTASSWWRWAGGRLSPNNTIKMLASRRSSPIKPMRHTIEENNWICCILKRDARLRGWQRVRHDVDLTKNKKFEGFAKLYVPQDSSQ